MLNKIWAQIHQKKPEAINEFAEPEVQYMLGNAMKTAGSTDDSVIHDVLVQLAVDHVLSEKRSHDRIINEQVIDTLQKMNGEMLICLQKIAFWQRLYAFINPSNVIKLAKTATQCSSRYIGYLESINCISHKRYDFYGTTPSEELTNIFGIYFHVDFNEMDKLSMKILGKPLANRVKNLIDFYSINKPKGAITRCWKDFLKEELSRDFKGSSKSIEKKIDRFISLAFDSEETIKEKYEIAEKNLLVLNYELTYKGFKLASALPDLLSPLID